MHVKIRITEQGSKTNLIRNPDYTVERLCRYRVNMPGGFGFGLNGLNHLNYPQRGSGSFKPSHNFILEFKIPIGYVTNNPYTNHSRTPNFKQQDTKFQVNVDKYILDIETRHEIQTI